MIYTKTGDTGTTGLFGGTRVSKADPRIECHGTVDELNAMLGLCAVAGDASLIDELRQVQADLFVIGSHLAAGEQSNQKASLPKLDDAAVIRLEEQIDAAEGRLPALRNFLLPGGTEAAARLHVARTVCRRAERLLVALAAQLPVDPVLLAYLNRLSDWLFVYSRLANQVAGVADIPWNPRA